MAGIKDYSTTQANNTSLNSINVGEGMLPSNLNNAIRALMKNTREWFNDSQWVEYGDGDGVYTAAYASATSFTIAGVDVSAIYHEGRRIKLIAPTPGTIYGTISSSTFSTNTTINVTWDSGSLSNEAITNVYIGALSKTNNSLPTGVIATATLADGSVTTIKISDSAVTTAKINDAAVTNAKLGADSVNGSKIADDSINSEHYVDGSIDTAHIADSQITTAKIADSNVTTAKIADSNVTTAKIANSNVTTAKIADSNVTTAKIAADAVDGNKIADDSINSEHYVDGSIDTQHIADSQITTAKVADSNITTAKIADSNVTTAKIADSNITTAKIANDAVTADKIADAVIVTNAEASGHTPNDTTFFTTSASDGRYFRQDSSETIASGDTWSGSDSFIATTAAIDARIIDLVDDVGGFVAIANEDSFPTTNPDINDGAGTIVSIADAGGMTYNTGTGVSTDAQTTGGSTVTINSIPAGIGSPIPNGYGMLVETTSTLNTYTFHRLVPIATEVTTVAGISGDITTVAGISADVTSVAGISSDVSSVAAIDTDVSAVAAIDTNVTTAANNITDINTFAVRYRIGATNPTTSLDEGDLFYNTTDNELKFYNGSVWSTIQGGISNVVDDVTPQLGGNLNTNGNAIQWLDNNFAFFGTGGATDMKIWYNGSNGHIEVVNGALSLEGGGSTLITNNGNNIISTQGDSAYLHYGGSTKLNTTSSGIDVTGNLTASGNLTSLGIDDNATSTAITIDSSQNVGIGILSPSSQLHLRETTSNTTTASDQVRIQAESSGTTGVGFGTNIRFVGERNGGTLQSMGRIGYVASTNTSSNLSSDFVVQTASAGVSTEKMRIDSSGNVGIGTSSPGAKLEIQTGSDWGNIINSTYAGTQYLQQFEYNGTSIGKIRGDNSSISIESGGSLQLQTVNTERMRIDNTGKVSIGDTTSSGYRLKIKGTIANDADDQGILLEEAGTGGAFIKYDGSANLLKLGGYNAGEVDSINIVRNTGEVGIGTTSPDAKLDIASPQTTSNKFTSPNLALTATVQDNNEGFTGISYASATITNYGWTVGATRWTGGTGDSHFTFRSHVGSASGNERVRIDTGGNLLVGKTSNSSALSSVGINLRPTANSTFTADGNQALQIGRLNSDGLMQGFYKDGSIIGSIGVVNSNNLYIQGDSTNSGLQCGTNTILPVQSGANASNTIDMGDASNLWKDLYLGGGLYVGGTGTANKLDDYEEGTWTMALSDGTNSAGSATGYYTKIGNMVFVRGDIGNVNTSALTNTTNDLIITGLPFATSSSKNGNQRTSGTVSTDQVSFVGYLTCETGYGSNTELRLVENNSGSSGDRVQVNQYNSGGADIWIEVSYPTEA